MLFGWGKAVLPSLFLAIINCDKRPSLKGALCLCLRPSQPLLPMEGIKDLPWVFASQGRPRHPYSGIPPQYQHVLRPQHDLGGQNSFPVAREVAHVEEYPGETRVCPPKARRGPSVASAFSTPGGLGSRALGVYGFYGVILHWEI